MLFFKPFKNGGHNCRPEEFTFVFDPIPVAIDAEGAHLPVIEHQGKPVITPQSVFFLSGTSHQYWFSG